VHGPLFGWKTKATRGALTRTHTHSHTHTRTHLLREADLRQASKHLTVVVECWRFNVAKTDSWSTTLLPLLPVIVNNTSNNNGNSLSQLSKSAQIFTRSLSWRIRTRS